MDVVLLGVHVWVHRIANWISNLHCYWSFLLHLIGFCFPVHHRCASFVTQCPMFVDVVSPALNAATFVFPDGRHIRALGFYQIAMVEHRKVKTECIFPSWSDQGVRLIW